MKNTIVIGANSAIAKEYLRHSIHNLSKLVLCGRRYSDLKVLEADLKTRNPNVEIVCIVKDFVDVADVDYVWKEMVNFCGKVDQVVLAAGVLPDNKALEVNPSLVNNVMMVNSMAPTIWALHAANTLESQKSGILCIITSVAGVRGRKSNYIYGCGKAQLIALCEGLRHRLAPSGVEVLDFRPGMVSSPMTAHLKKGRLMVSATRVGSELSECLNNNRGGVVYAPGWWKIIMFIIKKIPFNLFKKTNF